MIDIIFSHLIINISLSNVIEALFVYNIFVFELKVHHKSMRSRAWISLLNILDVMKNIRFKLSNVFNLKFKEFILTIKQYIQKKIDF